MIREAIVWKTRLGCFCWLDGILRYGWGMAVVVLTKGARPPRM